MSKWAELARRTLVPKMPNVPKVPINPPAAVVSPIFGDFGNFGTEVSASFPHPSCAAVVAAAVHLARPSYRCMPVQADNHRCYVCGGPEAEGGLFIPVLSGRPSHPHFWLHDRCWPEHVRRGVEYRAGRVVEDEGNA